MGAEDRRARVSRAHESRGVAAGDRLGGDADGRPGLAAERRHRGFAHFDDIGSLENTDGKTIDIMVPSELSPDDVDRSSQHEAQIDVPRGRDRAIDNGARRVISAHRVYSDVDHS